MRFQSHAATWRIQTMMLMFPDTVRRRYISTWWLSCPTVCGSIRRAWTIFTSRLKSVSQSLDMTTLGYGRPLLPMLWLVTEAVDGGTNSTFLQVVCMKCVGFSVPSNSTHLQFAPIFFEIVSFLPKIFPWQFPTFPQLLVNFPYISRFSWEVVTRPVTVWLCWEVNFLPAHQNVTNLLLH